MSTTKKKSSAAGPGHVPRSAGGRAVRRAVSGRVAADDPLSAERVRYLAEEFGGAGLAAIVGVNRSQTSRWVKGEERPGPGAAPLLIDLEHVLARARLVWGEEAARTWLESANVYLDGGRPIDVLQLSGPAPVLEALDAETWGGAA
ncbi:antitoxin Xre/MbcA/ParS toxin-binding domain-containing protein [Rhodococcus sp. B50]|uniref:antitoxin Xre/MbcA/ParS toxin-binding domain-containing protein n=1 Tax=Rhodococcus sp. B50 TaxID=2682847 RepID=UPI0019F80F1C|nr:antitoxin Xre/MbcA/ParS toxin-binding domain-containing protein [Rhodococcus sp. B50]